MEDSGKSNSKIIIAVDGHSSCGKGTLAKFIAQKLEYIFIDSGAMYRAVTLFLLRNGINTTDENEIANHLHQIQIDVKFNAETGRAEVHLNGENVESEIRKMEVAQNVSQVAKVPAVRNFLVSIQQQIGFQKGVVMDGRDIGTVVFPNAELKIFMTARPEIRAVRRFAELEKSGAKTTFEEVLDNLKNRDRIDSTREMSPLTLTPDYKLLDNSDLTIEEQNTLAMGWVEEITNKI